MGKIVDVRDAQARLPQLLDETHAGKEIVLSKAGKPYARLVPLSSTGKRRLGFLKGNLDDTFFDRLPDDELDAWEGK